MSISRSRIARKTIASFLLITFIHSVFFPSVALALTSGQHQPEFTSYEDANSTDMVNLLTGDFSLNVPLLEVPGPEGGFQVPLSYHAGIGPEQESSWVGLGWNVNVGAIVRSINQFPDDASGEANVVNVQDLTGVRGYDIQWLSPFREGWNSETGKYGNLNLLDIIEVQWGSTSSVGILGFHVGDDTAFKPQQFISGVMAIASLGIASAGEAAFSAVAKEAATQVAVGVASNMLAAGLSSGRSGSGATSGIWDYQSDSHKSLALTANPLKGYIGLKTTWKTWLDQTRQENMFGVLYAGLAPTQPIKTFATVTPVGMTSETIVGAKLNLYGTTMQTVQAFNQSTSTLNTGAASDINFTIDEAYDYKFQNSPVLLANDQFSVNARGISGSIKPYRLEIGSVSMPREMSDQHVRLAPIPYENYKVPFVYEGMAANRYVHHSGSVGSAPSTPGFNYAIQRTDQWQYDDYSRVEFNLQDYIFSTGRFGSDVATSKKIAQGNHIEWLTNNEIKMTTTYPSGFMDFLAGGASSPRSTFRSSMPNGIGGYAITSVDGQTYHFALPIYEFNDESKSIKVSDENKNSTITRAASFATTWLLTSITGPDFVDRNSNGLVDDGDWGFWMKFNYGKHSDNYDWRQPYSGYSLDPSGMYKNSQSGQKQLYYLNSIESRSHVALFMKSTREDGYSAAGTNIAPLKLDEIILLKKDHYKNLVASSSLPDFSTGVTSLCLTSQFTTTVRNNVNKNTIKRIIFNYDYSLCKNTPNALGSANPLKGKLTLASISTRGRNDIKFFPDYLFEYADNPNYNLNYWDGWGMYNPNGTSAVNTHEASQASVSNGTAWSLTKMTNPMGSELVVNYERDTYSSISGQKVFNAGYGFGKLDSAPPVIMTSYTSDFFTVAVDHGGQLSPGDKVKIAGHVGYTCGSDPTTRFSDYSQEYTVQSATSNSINVQADFREIQNCSPNSGTQITLYSDYGTVYKIFPDRKGGDIRVQSLIVQDQGVTYKTRYLYNNADGTSSGAISQEPAFIKVYEHPFYQFLNYPSTPVVYGRVSMLGGKLSNDSDFISKQIYEFEIPSASNYTQIQTDVASYADVSDAFFSKIEDRTSKVGRLNKVSLYDKNDALISQSQLQYTDAIANNDGLNYQGVFSESTLLFDLFNEGEKTIDTGGHGFDFIYVPNMSHIDRTTKIKYPNALKKVINTKDGLSSESENLKWDFISGTLLESITRSPQGKNVKTVKELAYRQTPYATMGPKASDISNKNMLSQVAATYNYRTDAIGVPFGLIDATAYTWKSDWANYTNYDVAIPGYKESVDGANVWRMNKVNIWMGDYTKLRSDGTQTFTSGNYFNFALGATNSGWQWSEEIAKYDHYSMPVQYRTINDIHTSVKMGYNNSMVIAEADNAKYNEIAFTSAEDLFADKPYFGSEVAKGSGTVVRVSNGGTTSVHTGDAALSLSTGYGFTFKSSGIEVKTYRASAWTNSTNGRIYAKINGVEQTSPAPTIQVGNWYQINFEIPVTSVPTSFEVGVKSASGTVLFDDFRFQPRDANMRCYVFNPTDYDYTLLPSGYLPEYTYVLDNDNLFMKYEYNERGVVVKTYKESIKYNGVKLLSESKENFRRAN